ncbi:DLW-39 family protein [Janibacter alittae]|uniref:DLW-39 family protein n=1 Tax=Janibacter alittae TaxID=3115209 RepID=A0ABZ2MHB4_9MICO
MKKVLALVAAAAAGAAYARHKVEQQRSEKDLHAATSRMQTSTATSGGAWAAATDRPS